MRSMGRVAASWRFLLLSLLWTTTALAKEEPSISVTKFDNPPLNINYFEDSDVIIFHDVTEKAIYRSTSAGANWTKVEAIPDRAVAMLYMHPYESKTAFVLTETLKHYKTEDRGETWESFSSGSQATTFQNEILIFHAGDPNRIIFNGMDCDGIFCDEEARYTTDGFKSVHLLRSYTAGCWWAKSTKEFTSGDDTIDKDRTMCIVRDPLSFFREDQKLYMSDTYFALDNNQIQEFEPKLDTKNDVGGVVNLASVKKYTLVATSSFLSDEMALYVTDDAQHWHRAMFPTDDSHDHSHQINQNAYTVLESTNYSIQIDVMTSKPSNPMGVIFTSNSNGTYFTENVPYTNRNAKGHVDFEKISGIQGIFLVNTVENGKEVDKKGEEKIVITQITFDDGRTFESIKAGDDTLHLHSVTQLDNIGRVFSSPAPGLVMGNGNTGKSLGAFVDSNLYVSDNAGVTWKEALKGPHKYEFGDFGSILVAVKDSVDEDVGEVNYSLDHGDNWESVSLPDDLKIKPYLLTTTQDSTSLKFLLLGEKDRVYRLIAIDFDKLGKPTCEKKDMEDWHARVDNDGNPTCIMGHKQTYQRRKKSADCFLKLDFKDPLPQTEDCECTDADFECDYNFQRDKDDKTVCNKAGPIPIPEGACKGGADDKFMGSSGWRLIPGNTCKRKSGAQKDDKVERKCSDGGGSSSPDPDTPASGEISHKQYEFQTELGHLEKFYLEKGDVNDGNDESVIVRPYDPSSGGDITIEHRLWLTKDHGKSWERILEGEKVFGIYQHLYFSEVAFFVSTDQKVIYTIDRGHTFHSFKAPYPAAGGAALGFHPDQKDWLIWHGKNCETIGGKEQCFTDASVSSDRGANWHSMRRYVKKCEFTGNSAYRYRNPKQVLCMAQDEDKVDGIYHVFTSDDFFVADKTVHKGPFNGIATMSEFILAAIKTGDEEDMQALASLDGKHFEPIKLPHNFHQEHQRDYTVLDSSTRAINLFVATSMEEGRRFGSIIKSNSNGTSYVLSASNVNCDDTFYVDYEKIPGLEGVSLINTVANPDKKGGSKEYQTKISHSDGADWAYLPPPEKDADGNSFKCSSENGDAKCALHLHHFTERDDKRRTFAAATTVGLFFGVGNVGATLGDYKDADTFMTTDGGITWRHVKKGPWTWQYGDQGSIIVLVQRATHGNKAKTKTVSYSTDEGKTWTDYKFSDEEVTVLDLTSVRSGTSRNFLVWCKSDSGKLFSVDLDFTGLANKPCQFLEDGDSDYEIWSPKHPQQDDDCLFGHIAKYLRKKPDRKCFNKRNLQRRHGFENCECSRRDFECAYNFELDNSGQCKLVPGSQPLTGKEWCQKNPNETTWYEPTGYRRVPLSTCRGGNEMDKTSTEHPCDGYEEEFEKKHRTSGWAIFFAVTIPFAAAAGIGWYVWRNWNGKFGQIRLGENSSTFDSDQPWIKFPVIAISAVAAVIAALPYVAAGLWRAVAGTYERVRGGRSQSWFSSGPRRFTTRDSFARGRGDYTAVDDDEGELLGEESDEEV